MITAVVLNYYQERQAELPRIIQALQAGTVSPDRILIWNNALNLRRIGDGIQIVSIESARNFGCRARFSVALLEQSEWVFFQDNDLVLAPHTLEALLHFARSEPTGIYGLMGKRLAHHARPYLHAETVLAGDSLKSVDVVLGRIMFLSQRLIPPILAFADEHRVAMFREDDIVASLSNRAASHRNYVAPVREGFRNLDEHRIGLSWESDHIAQRDEICRRLMPLI